MAAITSSRRKYWKEGELIEVFHLERIKDRATPLMQEWLDASQPQFSVLEQELFEQKLSEALHEIESWSEEDLKMKFIAFMLDLGHLKSGKGVVTFFDKQISGVVDNIKLTVKSDFMMASGTLDFYRTPYFHFQEYKPNKQPSGDAMAQLIEAFLIAQVENKSTNPLYGLEVLGNRWSFVVMEDKQYCVSQPFLCTVREDLLQIIAMFRFFKHTILPRLMKQ